MSPKRAAVVEDTTNAPRLLPTSVSDGKLPGISYRMEGALAPVLHLSLDGSSHVFFEHHVVLWKDSGISLSMRPTKNAFKRMLGKLPIFLTRTEGAGEIAFSRDMPGHIFPIALPAGSVLLAREHQYLAATDNVEYDFERVRGVANIFAGDSGITIDRFEARSGDAVVWMHGSGNVFEKTLEPGEHIDVEPRSWVYRDPSVQMDTIFVGLKTGLVGGGGDKVFFNRFTGPGRVALQSMYFVPPTKQ